MILENLIVFMLKPKTHPNYLIMIYNLELRYTMLLF